MGDKLTEAIMAALPENLTMSTCRRCGARLYRRGDVWRHLRSGLLHCCVTGAALGHPPAAVVR